MMLAVSGLEKSFHLYQQNDAHISVLRGAAFDVAAGECVARPALGCGKSSLMRMIYGNYRAEGGGILVNGTDMVSATPRRDSGTAAHHDGVHPASFCECCRASPPCGLCGAFHAGGRR